MTWEEKYAWTPFTRPSRLKKPVEPSHLEVAVDVKAAAR